MGYAKHPCEQIGHVDGFSKGHIDAYPLLVGLSRDLSLTFSGITRIHCLSGKSIPNE
tara:strand:- start:41 stop:211 length:171 start_codon:yes stop_codon:yes gene_type:complete